MTKTHFEKIDNWNLVEPTVTNFDKALDKWMGCIFGFLKKVWETIWEMKLDEVKYSFNMIRFNKLKEFKSLTKAKFNPNIDKFFQLIDDLSKDEKYCSEGKFTISKKEFDNLINTRLAWFKEILDEGIDYYEYWIRRLKNLKLEDSIEILQKLTLDDPKSLKEEDFVFIDKLLLFIDDDFNERFSTRTI